MPGGDDRGCARTSHSLSAGHAKFRQAAKVCYSASRLMLVSTHRGHHGPRGLGAKSRALSRSRTVVSGGMDRSQSRHGVLAGLFALLVAIFVLIPTVDAAACATELEPAHAAASVDSDGDDQPIDADGHAICSHGHCHHGGTTLPSSPQQFAVNPPVAASPLRPSSDALKSRIPSGPKRPPRT